MTSAPITALLFLLAVSLSAQTVAELNAELTPGINLGNSLEAPGDGSWTAVVPPEPAVIDKIADLGFKSLRVPVRWADYVQDEPPYAVDPTFLKTVDAVIDHAIKRDLKVILNVHHYDAFFDDPVGHFQPFLGMWSVLAEHYKDYPREQLFFEILNEPHGNMTQKEWQALFPAALMVVRATNPDRPVLLGGSPWNGWQTLMDLELPDDPNLIATFHYYLPFEFTHQGASWVEDPIPLGETFAGNPEDIAEMATHFAKVKVWADAQGIPVNIGEFGAYQMADMGSRVIWTRSAVDMANAFGFSWHYWEFGSGFGIWDPETDTYHSDLKDALLPTDRSSKSAP